MGVEGIEVVVGEIGQLWLLRLCYALFEGMVVELLAWIERVQTQFGRSQSSDGLVLGRGSAARASAVTYLLGIGYNTLLFWFVED